MSSSSESSFASCFTSGARPSCGPWAAVLVASVALLGCGPERAEKEVLTLGAVIDRTGVVSETTWIDALRMAESQMNAALAATGADFYLEYVIYDSANDPATAVERARELVVEERARGLVADVSQVTIALNRLNYDDEPWSPHVPIHCALCTSGAINSPTATDADPITQRALRNADRWVFKGTMSTKRIGQVMVDQLLSVASGDRNGDGRVKISVIFSDENFGVTSAADIKLAAKERTPSTLPVIIDELPHARDADINSPVWADLLRRAHDDETEVRGQPGSTKDVFPDATMVVNFPQQQQAVAKAYKLGEYRVKMIHGHAFRYSSSLRALGGLSEGIEGVSTIKTVPGPVGEAFEEEFYRRTDIRTQFRESYFYDAALSLMLSTYAATLGLSPPTAVTGRQIRDATSRINDPSAPRYGGHELVEALTTLSRGQNINYDGASGPYDWDKNGAVLNVISRYQVQNRSFVDVELFDCVKDATSCPRVQ